MSLKQNSGLLERGGVWDDGTTEHLLGAEFEMADVDWSSTDNVKPLLSSRSVRLRLVKSASATALLPGRGVKFAAANWGLEITGYSGAGEIADAVVDEYIPAAGVADNQLFLVVMKGPTTMVSDGSAVLAAGDVLVTAASGKAKKQTAAPADETAVMVQVNSKVGRAMEAATNVDGTTLRVDFRAA